MLPVPPIIGAGDACVALIFGAEFLSWRLLAGQYRRASAYSGVWRTSDSMASHAGVYVVLRAGGINGARGTAVVAYVVLSVSALMRVL